VFWCGEMPQPFSLGGLFRRKLDRGPAQLRPEQGGRTVPKRVTAEGTDVRRDVTTTVCLGI